MPSLTELLAAHARKFDPLIAKWSELVRDAREILDSHGQFTTKTVFGIEDPKERIMVRNLNSRVKREWRRRQTAKGKYVK